MADARLRLSACLVLLGVGCAGAPVREEPHRTAQPERPREPAARAGISDREWAWLSSQNARVDLMLPEREAWVTSEARGWLRAHHAASNVSVVARSWRAEGVVNRHGCEIEARRHARDLPQVAPEAVFASEDLAMPAGFDTHADFALVTLPDGSVEGVLSVFGAATRRCIALLAFTRASGPGAERAVVTRLGLLETGTARSLTPRGVEDRVRR